MFPEPLLCVAGNPLLGIEPLGDGRKQTFEDSPGSRLPFRGHMDQQLPHGGFNLLLFYVPEQNPSFITGQDALCRGKLFVKLRLEDSQRLQPDQLDRIPLKTFAALELGDMKSEGPQEAIDVAEILDIPGDAIEIEAAPTVLVEERSDNFVVSQPVQLGKEGSTTEPMAPSSRKNVPTRAPVPDTCHGENSTM